jgi:rhamnosyltransferase
MYNIAGVVILYYPEESKTLENILSYSQYLDKIYIIDNSEKASSYIKNNIHLLNKNTNYFHDYENKGIAARLNFITELSRDEGYQWLLTMDQDSSFSKGVFQKYLTSFNNFNKSDVAIFGVNFSPAISPIVDDPIEVISTITSGSLVNLELNKEIGKYNEDLFIDLIDAEYSYRAIALNYKIISFRNIILNHSLGYIQYGRSLKNFRKTPRILHSPVRIYYIVRNSLYMLYRFPDLPVQARKDIKKCLALLKNNLLYHKERLSVIKYTIKGFCDFKKGKMGKVK